MASDTVSRLEQFLREKYLQELDKAAREEKAVIIDFSLFDRFDPVSADQLLEDPENMMKAFREAAESITQEKINVRFRSLPESRNIRIRSLRSKHLNRFWSVDATIKAASEVKPQIYEAVFECPECHEKNVVPQDSNILKKPDRCEGTCGGRRGDFPLVEKRLYDVRWLQGIEPFEITTGEQPGEISILLKEDMTTPKMQKKTDPGSRLKITGVLKGLPKRIKGKLSTKMDMYLEANFAEPSEIEFEELDITPEDERKILELSRDPNVYEKLKASIAPGLWGFDEIKEAVLLQLFGGLVHHLPDGSRIRGNIHILLTGDPGVGKSISGDSKILYSSKNGCEYSTVEELFNKLSVPIKPEIRVRLSGLKNLTTFSIGQETYADIVEKDTEIYGNEMDIKVLSLNELHKIEWKPVRAFIKHKSPEKLVKIKTASGRTIMGTEDHGFLTLDPEGGLKVIKGSDVSTSVYIPVPMNWNEERIKEIDLSRYLNKRTNAVEIKNPIKLDEDSGFFFGMFLAEGSLQKGHVSIATNSTLSQRSIADFARKIGLNPVLIENSGNPRSDDMRLHSRDFVNFIRDTCYTSSPKQAGKGSGAGIKKLPSFAFFANRGFIFSLLSGIFSGDGYIIKKEAKGRRVKDSIAVGFTTISKNLAYDVIEILSSVGILASVKEKRYFYKSRQKTSYNIYISGKHASKFLKEVQLIDRYLHTERVAEKDSADSIPCGRLVYEIVKTLGYSRRLQEDAENKRAFAAMMRTVRKRDRIGRRRLERIFLILEAEAQRQKNREAFEKLEKIRTILQGDVVWDKVVSIEDVYGSGLVYDLSIDGNETFVANNIAVHNTHLLKLVSSMVPRGRYVSGSGVSGAGLTATVVKNEAIGGWVLEAGALILCNKGLIAIDEFDKMSKDDQIAMHEATSIETVSIAKASIVATLPAETAVLAGANPQYGRFDPYKSVAEQIQIPETLLSRFDLKFALQDRPDKTTDSELADHIIMTRRSPQTVEPVIGRNLLRKYIAYGKQIKDMELTEEAALALKDFYVDMRNRNATSESSSVSITLRQYEALIRLAEASAKIRLDVKVLMEDADRAIRLMKYSLTQLGYDYETGRIDIDRVEGGMPASKRRKISLVMEIIDALQKESKEIAIEDIRAEAENRGIEGVDEVIERLRREGTIFEPRSGFVRKV